MGFDRRGSPEEHPRAGRIHQAARVHGVCGKHIHASGPERGEGGTARPRLGPWIAYTTFILLARNIFEGRVEGTMAGLLNFDSNRKLDFDVGRPLEFDVRRPLDFDSARPLEFQPNRDLGFGRRGVVFRGYVCPICGSLVTEDSKRCTECGTVFDSDPRAAGPPAGIPTTGPALPPKSTSPMPLTAKTGAPTSTVYCVLCGARPQPADGFCWNCGTKQGGATGTARVPGKKTPPATRDWRGPR